MSTTMKLTARMCIIKRPKQALAAEAAAARMGAQIPTKLHLWACEQCQIEMYYVTNLMHKVVAGSCRGCRLDSRK